MQIHQMPSASKGTKASTNLYRRDSMDSFDLDQDFYNIHGVALRRKAPVSEVITPEIKNKFLIFFNKDNKAVHFFSRLTWKVLFSLGFLFYYLPKKYVILPLERAYLWMKKFYQHWSDKIRAIFEEIKKKVLEKMPTSQIKNALLRISKSKKFFQDIYCMYSLKVKNIFGEMYAFLHKKALPWIEWMKLKKKAFVEVIKKITGKKELLSSLFLKLDIQNSMARINVNKIDLGKTFSYKTLQHTTELVREKIVKVRSLVFFVMQHIAGFAYVFNLRVNELFREVVSDVQQTLASYDLNREKKHEAR